MQTILWLGKIDKNKYLFNPSNQQNEQKQY